MAGDGLVDVFQILHAQVGEGCGQFAVDPAPSDVRDDRGSEFRDLLQARGKIDPIAVDNAFVAHDPTRT